jgi:uncharacterized phage protein (TIGR02218 family)
MRTIPSGLAAHLTLGTTSLATCWRVTLQNGTVYGFTDHDQAITVSGVVYEASSGFLPSAIMTQSRLAVDNQTAQGFLDSENIDAADLSAGLWDHAEIYVFRVNWRDVSLGVEVLSRGHLGEVGLQRGVFNAEVRGLTAAYSQAVGEVYQPGCRADFGDARCGVALGPWTVSGTVAAVGDGGLVLSDPSRTEPGPDEEGGLGYFVGGKITMTSGASDGLSMEVKAYSPGSIGLQLQLPRGVAVGDTYIMHAGCGKRFVQDCVARFGNGINFRGEPHVPGIDQIIQVGGARARATSVRPLDVSPPPPPVEL